MNTMYTVICTGCLNVDRKMILLEGSKKQCFSDIIKHIPMSQPVSVSVFVCWECAASLSRFVKFKEQVIDSYTSLHSLNCKPKQMQYTKITMHKLFNISYPELSNENACDIVKTENNFEDIEKIEEDIKEELDTFSNDDEAPLIEMKKRRKKKVINDHTKKTDRNGDVFQEIEISKEELEKERAMLALKDDYVNAMFKCERCIMSFPNADDLMDHVDQKHNLNASKLKCEVCECTFSTEVSFNYHTSKHRRRSQCVVCLEMFANRRAAVKHYNMAHCVGTELDYNFEKTEMNDFRISSDGIENNSEKLVVSRFPCEFCAKTFSWKTSLRKHLETHRIESGQKRRPYCEPCKLSFTTTSNLQKHVKTSFKHQIQLKLSKMKESVPEDTSSPEKQQACIAEIRSSVNSTRQQFLCPQCGKSFLWRGNLLRHLHSHAAQAKGELVCAPCNRTFSSIATYRQHLAGSRKHVSEEDFKFMCSECGKRFANKTLLKDHVNWEHLKNYVHKCTVCSKVFKSHTSLYLHKQVVHKKDGAEHLCDHCGKPFPNKAKLRGHITAVHSGGAAYRCDWCGARFAWHSCLSRHVRRLHRTAAPAADAT